MNLILQTIHLLSIYFLLARHWLQGAEKSIIVINKDGAMQERLKRPSFSPEEIRIETFKSSGPGGQHKNKRETAVRIRHLPSGITALATEHRSQVRNKALALRRLELKVHALGRKKRPRIPTSIPASYKEHVLQTKRHRAQLKRLRKKITPLDI
jgi:protein subunit release factor A